MSLSIGSLVLLLHLLKCHTYSVIIAKNTRNNVFNVRFDENRRKSMNLNVSLLGLENIDIQCNDSIIRSENQANIINNHVSLGMLALLIGLSSSLTISYGKVFVAYLEKYRAAYPILSPILGSFIISLLFWSRKDITTGPANMFQHDPVLSIFSLSRQSLRIFATWIAVGTGNPVALAGPHAELGIAIGKCYSLLHSKFHQNIKNISFQNNFLRDINYNTLLLSGAAAGFTANFDTPLAGIMYALEVS